MDYLLRLCVGAALCLALGMLTFVALIACTEHITRWLRRRTAERLFLERLQRLGFRL